MIVAISVLELHIPECTSLKQKRRIVKSLVERIHRRYKVSVAETDYHDLHQRAEIAVAAVHTSQRQMEEMMQGIRSLADDFWEAQVVAWDPQYLEASP